MRTRPGPRSTRVIPACWAALLAAAPDAALAAKPGEELRTPGGEIVARRPDGAGWTCEPAARAGDGFRLAELRCTRAAGAADLRLYAKDYAGPSEQVEGICARDWREYYRGTFREVARLDARLVRLRGRRTCAVDAQGTTPAGQPLRIREWYAVAPGHVLLGTAAGPAEAVHAGERAVARWRDGVRFQARAR